ncbi:phosphonate metabolism transcriptional regulator PhnF [Roseomonas sp. SSH11]|uniref:Phosphonate metabolism transcriptional regulator PhnF n=1 Tax=Pararoseomonas baculiformis TaxID=2820812 RepID=A0ABS4AAS1_9PROT|nr:phosphonate metabolism transcriptional regulator PhnF [Pararoseomonas baculiformis]
MTTEDTSTAPSWRDVQQALGAAIRDGSLAPGSRLPTEPLLMARFGAGRHSIRRAVAALAAEGLVRTRQGSGTYVREAPVLDYRLSERTRFSENLLVQGREPSGRALGAIEEVAGQDVAEALRLPPGSPVFQVRRLGLADGVPVNLSIAYYPARRFPGMLGAWEGGEGASAILAAYGIADYRRVASTVLARLPSAGEAQLLDQHEAQPVLVVRKVDADLSGIPIACSETIWAAERVQLSVDHAPREEDPHVDR